MHSSNFYRNYSSPYKAPSKSANTYDVASNRSRSNLHDTYDETWPLDEVINKIDIKSDSEDDFSYHRNNPNQSWKNGTQYAPDSTYSSRYTQNADRVYSAFPDSTKSWANSRRHDYSPRRETLVDSSNRWNKPSTYDTNNNYLSDDTDQWFEDESPSLRDVGIQCNLKKYPKSVKQSAIEAIVPITTASTATLSQKPPIKVIKSTTNGFVSAYSDVPKLSSAAPKSLESPYCALDFDGGTSPEPSDAIYSQVDKSGKYRPPSSNNNINIIYKQPLNESIKSYRSVNDGKVYDVKAKEYGFNLSNSNAPRINLPNPMPYPNSSYLEQNRVRSYNGSYRDLNEATMPPVEKEILEETISISNASTEDSYRPMDRLTVGNRSGDNMSFTGNSVTSKTSSNYRRESPVRPPYDRSSLSKPSPYGTMEKNRSEAKSKLKKKKSTASPKNDENVLLANNSLRLKSSRHPQSERLYKSNADLRDQFMRDETRGGLAAAYKNRQSQQHTQHNNNNRQRALSLNRMNAISPEDEPYSGGHGHGGPVPSRYQSQTHLNGGGGTSSRLSDSSSYHRSGRHTQHERDPIVMYIPTVNHQRASGESPKLTSILRNNSTKSTANSTLPSKSKKEAKSQSKINLKEAAKQEKAAEKKKADLNRRHSMPKDAKLNGASSSWFSKFKLKSNK